MYLFFFMALGFNDFDAGKSITGPRNGFTRIAIISSRTK
jgi:hypothetical protein